MMENTRSKRVKSSVMIFFAALGLLATKAAAQQLDVFTESGGLLRTIGTALGCDLSARLKADMPVSELYRQDGLQCVRTVPVDSGRYYTDPDCSEGLNFVRTSQQQFCASALDKENMGNGESVINGEWTLSPGTRYDIRAATLDGLTQPYRSSVVYRQMPHNGGECQLEMRIYKSNPEAMQQLPMLAFHGGSWTSRGFGALGIEATVPHYTQRGFTVFAPFYRLLGDSEGGTCGSATLQQIVADVSAALAWVEANATAYGAVGKPLVFGQSAGAHLALTLAVSEPERVAGAVLLYPPTDFEHFVLQAKNGAYTNAQGLEILSRVLGTDATDADVSQTPVPENTYPPTVAAQPALYPPMYLLHGLADELVLPDQSIRLCNALAGRAVDEGVDLLIGRADVLSQSLSCGAESKLQLFTEGEHALDVCLSTNELLSAGCLSGSAASKALIADTLNDASLWSESVAKAANNIGELDARSGGGTMFLYILLAITLLRLTRRS